MEYILLKVKDPDSSTVVLRDSQVFTVLGGYELEFVSPGLDALEGTAFVGGFVVAVEGPNSGVLNKRYFEIKKC